MKIKLSDNDFMIVNTINTLRKAINGKDFEEVSENKNKETFRTVFNKTNEYFDFDYYRLGGTVKKDENGNAVLLEEFDFYDNNGNILFSFYVEE